MARDRFTLDFDPDCGDAPLSSARQDIVIGRWQGLRDLLRNTGAHWLAGATGSGRSRRPARAVRRSSRGWPPSHTAATHSRYGRRRRRPGRSMWPSRRAGASDRPEPRRRRGHGLPPGLGVVPGRPHALDLPDLRRTPLSVGVRRQELARWWDELHRRDPYSVEGHLPGPPLLLLPLARQPRPHVRLRPRRGGRGTARLPTAGAGAVRPGRGVPLRPRRREGPTGRGGPGPALDHDGASATYAAPGSAGSPHARTAPSRPANSATSTTLPMRPVTRGRRMSRRRCWG